MNVNINITDDSSHVTALFTRINYNFVLTHLWDGMFAFTRVTYYQYSASTISFLSAQRKLLSPFTETVFDFLSSKECKPSMF